MGTQPEVIDYETRRPMTIDRMNDLLIECIVRIKDEPNKVAYDWLNDITHELGICIQCTEKDDQDSLARHLGNIAALCSHAMLKLEVTDTLEALT